ncbi:ABC transporter permease subunit [Azospirillum sp. sgz301742]
MLSFALRRFAGTLPAVLLLAAAAAFATPDGAGALARAAAGLPATLALVGGALAAGLVVGAPLGLIAGYRPGSAAGRVGAWLAGIGAALPGFLAAALAFAVLGADSPASPAVAALALALPVLAEATRLGCGGAGAVAAQGFVLTARGRGVPARRVFLRHALPAALTPLAGALGSLAAGTIAGAAAAETLFGLPGTGRMLVEAARAGDAGGTAAAAALLGGLALLLRAGGAVVRGGFDPRTRVG